MWVPQNYFKYIFFPDSGLAGIRALGQIQIRRNSKREKKTSRANILHPNIHTTTLFPEIELIHVFVS